MKITPELYQTDADLRRIADGVAARAGVDVNDVREMEPVAGGWRVEVLLRDAAGKFYVGGGDGLASRELFVEDAA